MLSYLLKIDKVSKESFHYTILFLGLAICLEVKSGRKFLLNALKIA